jgi:hypothetical protein
MATRKKAASKKKSASPPNRPRVPEEVKNADVTITVTGPARAVRRTLAAMRFTDDDNWTPAVTRQIALDETGSDEATLDDKLGHPPINFTSQDDRELYRDRVLNEADDRGHPVADPSKIPNKKDTTVREVGDALFNHSS